MESLAEAASRLLLYPSLAYNLARSKLQPDWRWHTAITPQIVLGALPFLSTLEELKELGVTAVVTLNQEFELFLTAQNYEEHGIEHLWLPTVDYLFAPPLKDLHRGVAFIAEHVSTGRVYIHCKAGRGRSTTLLLCYFIKEAGMTPTAAFGLVKSKRPQICLSRGQWLAVEEFHQSCCGSLPAQPGRPPASGPPTSVGPPPPGELRQEASLKELGSEAKPAGAEQAEEPRAVAAWAGELGERQEEGRERDDDVDDDEEDGSRTTGEWQLGWFWRR